MSSEPEPRMVGEAESDRAYAVGVVLGPDGVHRLKVIRMDDKVQVYSTAASWGLEESMARAAAAMRADVALAGSPLVSGEPGQAKGSE